MFVLKKKFKTQQEKVNDLVETLEEGVLNFLPDPEKFKAILEMKALLPSYSFRNLLVAKIQYPDARFLAGFKHWEKLGRNVKYREKAIRIFAPRFKKVKDKVSDEEKSELKGFVTVPVFDYSQTEGDSLPIDKLKIKLEGDCQEARNIISIAEYIAELDDCIVNYGDTGSANGFYNLYEHSITVSDKLSVNHRCKTLVHELVHSRVDRLSCRDNRSKSEIEVVAEGTAFVVCSYFGLDTSDYSFDYVKGWGKEDNPILTYGGRISRISSDIINHFEWAMTRKHLKRQKEVA